MGNLGPTSGQIYSDLTGGYALYVRSEQREGCDHVEHLFVFVKDRVVYQRWGDAVPDDYALVNDVAGRKEAALAWAETQALQLERDTLLQCLKSAVGMLDDRAAEELRGIYMQAMEKAELVSVATKEGK